MHVIRFSHTEDTLMLTLLTNDFLQCTEQIPYVIQIHLPTDIFNYFFPHYMC